ncbi:MAG TPA: serine hydrolase [Ferruginibacter sp.]|nr:serine hydrolase [Ferruginibacter sp.]
MPGFNIRIIYKLSLIFFLVSCTTSKPRPTIQESQSSVVTTNPITTNKEDAFLEGMFSEQHGIFDSILANRKNWNVQVIYTQINRAANGRANLKYYYFNKKDGAYFYPASTVKFPVALLALQKLNELKIPALNRNTTMITEAAYSGQTPVYNDPNTPDGKPSIAQYIKRVFLVSDNDAYNRLYEFLGQEYINKELHRMGYEETRIVHRLEIFLNEDENRHTNPINFYDPGGKLVYSQPMQFNTVQYSPRNDFLGKGFYSNGQLHNEPMNFSKKNRISLESLHNILLSVIFPDKARASQRFKISEDDRKFVLKYMSQFPRESLYPSYDSSYQDAYVKLLLYGNQKEPIPNHIRIFNKEGDAYGQLTDIAYVADLENKIEFMVSATIYCNTDGILNDDAYDYETIGLPFLKELGKAIYKYESERKRNKVPDLSSIMFTYDK